MQDYDNQGLEIASMDSDDGYVSPSFDLPSDDDDDDGATMYDPSKHGKSKKRKMEQEEVPREKKVDLEALALRALAGGKR